MKRTPSNNLLLTERSIDNDEITVFNSDGKSEIYVRRENVPTMSAGLKNTLKSIFLPNGYPDSVSDDYWDYQVWDTAQAFCSTITGAMTTHAILKGVGVGDVNASSLSAAITWILKDGSGMIGRILFAWIEGPYLDASCKKWRFMADILNDIALSLEFLLPQFTAISTQILCITTVLKSIVGVAGGATRASITQHQAIKNNLADVSAKDSSQETCVNLLASFLAIFVMTVLEGHNDSVKWLVFSFLTTMHLIFNYNAIKSLNFNQLNESRLILLLKTYLNYSTVALPKNVNKVEPILYGEWLHVQNVCGFKIKMGASLRNELDGKRYKDFMLTKGLSAGKPFIISPNMSEKMVYIGLEENAKSDDMIAAYFYAVMFAMMICMYNDIPLSMENKRQLRLNTAFNKLSNMVKNTPNNDLDNYFVPMEALTGFAELMITELNNFFTALTINGWDLNRNSLPDAGFRYKIEEAIDKELKDNIPSFIKNKRV